jgi:hypothetical protein
MANQSGNGSPKKLIKIAGLHALIWPPVFGFDPDCHLIGGALSMVVTFTAQVAAEAPVQLLAKLSLEELSDIQVTSVSKSAKEL